MSSACWRNFCFSALHSPLPMAAVGIKSAITINPTRFFTSLTPGVVVRVALVRIETCEAALL